MVAKTTIKVGADTRQAEKSLSSLGTSLKALGALAAGFFAAKGVINTLKTVTQAASIQEDAVNSLDTSLKLSGQFTEQASKDFQEFASSIQKVTTVGDEAILQNAALIQSMGQLSNEALKDATAAAVDLSAAIGVDLTTASLLLGKAAAGNISSLSRYGIVIKKTGDTSKDFANVLEKLQTQFGGAAAAKVNTYSGAVQQLSNTWGDLLEELGFFITKNPVVIKSIKDLSKFIGKLIGDVGKFGTKIVSMAVEIEKVFVRMRKAIETVNVRDLAEDFAYFAGVLGSIAFVASINQISKLTVALKTLGIALAIPTKAFIIMAGKAALIGTAIVAAGSFIEVFIRNLDLLALRIKATGASIGVALLKPLELISKASVATAEGLNAIGIVSNEVLQGVTKRGIEVSNQFAEMRSEVDIMENAYRTASETIESGFIAGSIQKGVAAIDEFNKGLEKTEDALKGVGDNATDSKNEVENLKDGLEAIPDKIATDLDVSVDARFDTFWESFKTQGSQALLSVATTIAGVLVQGTQQTRATLDEIGDIEKKQALAKSKNDMKQFDELQIEKEKAEKKLQGIQEEGAKKTLFGTAGAVASIWSEGAGKFIEAFGELASDPEAFEQFISGLSENMPQIVDSIVAAMPAITDSIIEHIPAIAGALVKGIVLSTVKSIQITADLTKRLFERIFSQLFGEVILDVEKIEQTFQDIYDTFVAAPNEFIKGLIIGAADFIGELVKQIRGKLGISGGGGGGFQGVTLEDVITGGFGRAFAGGGVIPQGFPNDSFPARLTSGEVVLNKDQQNALGADSQITQTMLGQILQNQNAPIQVSTTLSINEESFGNIILDLNRDNRRLA